MRGQPPACLPATHACQVRQGPAPVHSLQRSLQEGSRIETFPIRQQLGRSRQWGRCKLSHPRKPCLLLGREGGVAGGSKAAVSWMEGGR